MDAQARAIQAALTGWLDAREPREKVLLGVGGALLLAALLYTLLWEPAWEGRAKIAAQLPQLQAQLEDVRAGLDEARRLRGAAALQAPQGQALRDALTASLAAAGIVQPRITVIGKGVQVDAKSVPFGTWMSWLDDVRHKDQARVVNAHASAASQPGRAAVSATLQPAGQP